MLGSTAPARAGALLAKGVIWHFATRCTQLVPLVLASVQYAPARGLERCGRLFLGGALHLMLALLAGWMSGRVIHARRVHWSWAGAAFAICAGVCILRLGWLFAELPVIDVLGAPGILVAALAATHLSRRWQVAEERSAGAFARLAAERGGPVEALQRLGGHVLSALGGRSLLCEPHAPTAWRALAGIARRAGVGKQRAGLVKRSAAIFSKRAAAPARGSSLALGFTIPRTRPVRVPLGHTVVLGATGSGKTVTMRRLLALAAETTGVVAVDGKGDYELERDLKCLARKTGRRFLAWSPSYTTRYSPFSRGSDTEIVDKALAAESFGDDYYLRLGQRFLGFAVRALRAAGSTPTLSRLALYVDPENLEQLAPAMEEASPGSWNDLLARIPRLDRGERQAIAAHSTAWRRWRSPMWVRC